MESSYVQLVSVLVGAGAAIGGGVLAHVFTRAREARGRQLEGLREVHAALTQLARIALEFSRFINIRLTEKSVQEVALEAVNSREFGELVLIVHEQRWRFACLAYLPEALEDFNELDVLMGRFMDPFQRRDGDDLYNRSLVEFRDRSTLIEGKLKAKLSKVL